MWFPHEPLPLLQLVGAQREKKKRRSKLKDAERPRFSGIFHSPSELGSISAALSCGRSAGSFPEQRLVIEPTGCLKELAQQRLQRDTSFQH